MIPRSIAQLDSLKAQLDALRPLLPEQEQRLWQKLRLEWNYNSNHIEGNTLTYGETFLLLVHNKTNGGHDMWEFEEMKAHDLAVSLVKEAATDAERPFVEADIRALNRLLLKEPFWKEAITPAGQPTRVEIVPGEYKRQPNNVRLPNGEIFHFASVEETPVKMRELMEWLASSEELHPILKAAEFHHRFVLIHPFGDGNGRTARLVVNYILMRAGYMPVVIKSADKANYLRVLQLADAGDLMPLTEYMVQQEQWALELGLKAARGESLEEPSDWEKRAQVLFRQADEEQRVDRSDHEKWRARVARWIELNFDELITQVRNKVLVFEKFYSANSFTYVVSPKESSSTFEVQFDRVGKTEFLDLWTSKELSTVAVHLYFKKYKFKGSVADKAFLFTINFEAEQVRFHWFKPEPENETIGYNEMLIDKPVKGLDRGAAWIYADIEKAQSE